MKSFQAPIDDILFSLKHVAGAAQLPDWDAQTALELGRYFAEFAEKEIAPLDAPGDRHGCSLVDGRVLMPAGFADTYRAYADQGWPGLCTPVEYGGQGLSSLQLAIISEIFSGANHSFQMVVGLVPGAVRTLLRFGTGDQKSRYIPMLSSGEALATMCLTEPAAGSDLSCIGCRAQQRGNDWEIHGEKIFISGGDQNLSERSLHLVLARTSNTGIKGLSLLLCPSVNSNGQRNAVSVGRIEEKMGLHASPTCHLIFDGAEAELIGEEGNGLSVMFTMMNHARIDVALQGVAHAARSYDIASSYAAERRQGRDSQGATVTLDQHADVRRMLGTIDWLACSSRAVVQMAAVALEKGESDLADLLTPVAKVYCSEAGIDAAELAMQVLGGYGYLREYRIEQTYRDARIVAIYEGANGIHERALATRLAGKKAGDAFAALLDEESDRWKRDNVMLQTSIWKEARRAVVNAEHPETQAHQFMRTTINALLSCVLARLSAAAPCHRDPQRIKRLCAVAVHDK